MFLPFNTRTNSIGFGGLLYERDVPDMKKKLNCRAIMIQGTASGVGKSLVTLGLCRLFAKRGIKVAPFKSQNMSLNASVTIDGGEIGRAQAEQARAAGVEPSIDMNPILLKPESGGRTQVVVRGESYGCLDSSEYAKIKPRLTEVVTTSLENLFRDYELVIIEGAGSPVEMNLKEHDIVNMFVAKVAGNVPVILVSDIDRGGVFASIVGTLELLSVSERELVKGFIINKFRGNPDLFEDGVSFLQNKTNKPVLGVLPFLSELKIADEDALDLKQISFHNSDALSKENIIIHIVKFPYIANYDEFDSLCHEPGVRVHYIDDPCQVMDCHLLIIPGSKSTMGDMSWVYETNIAESILLRHQKGLPILGVCGGCQMLGHKISDPSRIEGSVSEMKGLGILGFDVLFESPKITALSNVELIGSTNELMSPSSGGGWSGYEIHCGRFVFHKGSKKIFNISKRGKIPCENEFDGSASGFTVGTMIHGLLENADLRRAMLTKIAQKFSLDTSFEESPPFSKESEYNRVSECLESHLDIEVLESFWR